MADIKITDFTEIVDIPPSGLMEISIPTASGYQSRSVQSSNVIPDWYVDPSGNLTPKASGVQSIGSPSSPVKHMYVEPSSLFIGDTSLRKTPDGLFFGNQPVSGQGDPVESIIKVRTANGWGSTNTVIRRFSVVDTNVGSDITYADSSTDGATFTINKDGIYTIAYTDMFSTAATMGVSVNSTELTTAVWQIAAADKLGEISTATNGYADQIGVTTKLYAGDIVRAHTDSASESAGNQARTSFLIARVGDSRSGGSFTKDTFLLDVDSSNGQSLSSGNAWNTVIFENANRDKYSAYNASTGEWTAPKNMNIRINANLRFQMSANNTAHVGIFVNGTAVRISGDGSPVAFAISSVQAMITVNSGDVVTVRGYPGVATTLIGIDDYNYFQIEECIAGSGGSSSIIKSGTTTIGVSVYSLPNFETVMKRIFLTAGSMVHGICAHLNDNGSNVPGVGVGIYSDNAGSASQLIAGNHTIDPDGVYFAGTARWYTMPITYYADSDQYVWIAVHAADNVLRISYETTGSDARYNVGGKWLNDASSITTGNDYSMYALIKE